MNIRVLLALVIMGTCLVGVSDARAQDPTPEPGSAASLFLPEADLFGDGWTLDQVVSPDIIARYSFEMTPDGFREGAAGVYLGPNGARVVAVALLITESRVAIRQSWEDATELFDVFRYNSETDYQREEALESMDPPEGCVEAKRSVGVAEHFLVPTGVTLCAADPDIVVLAAVSGAIDDLTGVAASDAVAQWMVGAGS